MQARLLPSLGLALLLAPTALAQPSGFPTLNGIVAQMQAASANFPNICQVYNLTVRYGLAQTWQGNDIWAVKISDNVRTEEDEPAFLMVASHHSNEYGTPIVALDAINRLTSGYAGNAQIRRMVDNNEIWIVPMCNPDGYWTSRHNRNPNGTVDLNRNYPWNWASPCNTGVRGRGPGSEPETKTIMALSDDQHFAKVLDYHSSGREVLYAYRQSCPNHRLTSYLRAEAVAISNASSYGGRVRGPSSDGEHYQHQLGTYSNYAFLTEISTTQSPSISSANNEATRVWPGTIFMIERPIPVSGHVVDSVTGAPVQADISYLENPFTKGEQNFSELRHGRYHAFLPIGNHTIRFESSCYFTQDIPVTVTSAGVTLDVQLVRDPSQPAASVSMFNGNGSNPVCLSALNAPVAGTNWNLLADVTSIPSTTFALFIGSPASVNGPQWPLGQVLGTPANRTFTVIGFNNAGFINVAVPLTNNLVGTSGSVQAWLLASDAVDSVAGLCNALDYTVGCR